MSKVVGVVTALLVVGLALAVSMTAQGGAASDQVAPDEVPSLAAATQFRQSFGLRADAEYVQSSLPGLNQQAREPTACSVRGSRRRS